MKNKELKILLLGILIGAVMTLLLVRIADELSQEVLILDDEEMDDLFIPTDKESTGIGEESSVSALENLDLEQF